MISSYYHLLRSSYWFFCFSILGIFFSAPGQTFLISLTIPTICNKLQISPLGFASIYSTATLLASFGLPFIGKKIDIWTPQTSLLFNAIFFSASLFLFAFTFNSFSLFISLFFMRLFGQGALTLTATSHTIKIFQVDRGSALSLTQLGYPLSEFVFPAIFLYLLSAFGLSFAFIFFGFTILFLYLPITYTSISKDNSKITPPTKHQASIPLKEVLKDPFFPIYILLSSLPPIIMTAAFYFQTDIFATHQWDIQYIALAIFYYALLKLISTILVGPLIDRIGVIYPFTFLILFIGIASLVISIKTTSYF